MRLATVVRTGAPSVTRQPTLLLALTSSELVA
jgi:hypothetical protein